MFDPTTLTGFHTWLSLIGIATGVVVIASLLKGRLPPLTTALYFVTSVGTSVTGFLFPFTGFLPSHAVGIVSLLVLAPALLALYVFALHGAWRWIYAVTTVASIYLLVFVAIAQAFMKVPALKAAAPTQAEPPFAIAQGINLLLFVILGVLAVRRCRPPAVAAA